MNFIARTNPKKGTWGENTLVIALGCVCSCYCIYLYLSSTITYLTTLLSLLFMFKSKLLKSKIELFTVDYFTKKARFPWSEDCCNLPFCAPARKPFFAEEASTVETRPTPTDPLAFGGGGLVASPRATGTCDQGNWMLANFLWNQPQPAQFSLLLFRRFFRFRVLKFAHIF